MNRYLRFFLFGLMILLFFPSEVCAQVVINEFSVDPPDNYDWIEIYSPEIINISNWKVADEAGDFYVIPEGTSLGPSVYYVFSKYQRLNNDKDTIYLYDNGGNLKNSIKYGYAGEVCLPSTNGSIARIPDGGSTYDRLSVSTKGQSNGTMITDPCPTPSPPTITTSTAIATTTATATPTVTPTPTPTPTKSPTPVPTKVPTAAPTKTPQLILGERTSSVSSDVAGLRNELATPKPASSGGEKSRFPFVAVGLVAIGAAFIGTAGFLAFKKSKVDLPNPE